MTTILSHQPNPSEVAQGVTVSFQVQYDLPSEYLDITSLADTVTVSSSSSTGSGPSCSGSVPHGGGSGSCVLEFQQPGDYLLDAFFPGFDIVSGSEILVTVNESGSEVVSHTVVGPTNLPPVATIIQPADGSQFQVGDTVSFQGSGSDSEDDPASLSYLWDFAGCADAASGASVSVSFEQTHSACTATLTVTDTGELSATDTISFSVGESFAGGGLSRQNDSSQFVELGQPLSLGALFTSDAGVPVAGVPIQWTLSLLDTENLDPSLYPSFAKLQDAQGNEVGLGSDGRASVQINTNAEGISTVRFSGTAVPSSYSLSAREPQSASQISYSISTGAIGNESEDSPEGSILSVFDRLCPRMAGMASDLTEQQTELLMRCSTVVGAEDSAAATEAARQMAPEELAAQSQIGIGIGNQQLFNVTGRLARLRGSGLASATAGFNLNIADTRLPGELFSRALSAGGAASADTDSLLGNGWGVFITGDVFFGDKDETTQEAGFDFETLGLTAGIDRRVNDDLILGAAVGYASTDSDIDSNGGDVNVDGFTLTLYGNYYFDDSFYLDGTVAYGWQNFDTDRNIRYTIGADSVDTVASGSTDGTQFSASLGAGYDMAMDNGVTVNLNTRLAYLNGDIDGYEEQDEKRLGLNLAYDDQSYESLTMALGGSVSRALSYEWGVLIPELSLEWEHEFMGDPVTIQGSFVNDPADGWNPVKFSFDSNSLDSDYFRLGVGSSAVLGQGRQLFVRYEHLLGYDNLSQGRVSGGLRLEW